MGLPGTMLVQGSVANVVETDEGTVSKTSESNAATLRWKHVQARRRRLVISRSVRDLPIDCRRGIGLLSSSVTKSSDRVWWLVKFLNREMMSDCSVTKLRVERPKQRCVI